MNGNAPKVRRIAVHPIKALDPMTVKEVTTVPTGSLEYDREYAIMDDEGEYVHGKRTAQVHKIRASYDFGADYRKVTLREESSTMGSTFDLPKNREGAEQWLSEFFQFPTKLERNTAGGYPDLMEYPSGPTIISTGTIRQVASWFSEITPEEVRLRFRANIEIEGVPPFWEDRLYAATDKVRFKVGDVMFYGVQPTPRCVVPLRNPYTGEKTDGFRENFVTKRSQTYPEWGDEAAVNHFFNLMINTHVPNSEVEKTISIADSVTIIDDSISDRTDL